MDMSLVPMDAANGPSSVRWTRINPHPMLTSALKSIQSPKSKPLQKKNEERKLKKTKKKAKAKKNAQTDSEREIAKLRQQLAEASDVFEMHAATLSMQREKMDAMQETINQQKRHLLFYRSEPDGFLENKIHEDSVLLLTMQHDADQQKHSCQSCQDKTKRIQALLEENDDLKHTITSLREENQRVEIQQSNGTFLTGVTEDSGDESDQESTTTTQQQHNNHNHNPHNYNHMTPSKHRKSPRRQHKHKKEHSNNSINLSPRHTQQDTNNNNNNNNHHVHPILSVDTAAIARQNEDYEYDDDDEDDYSEDTNHWETDVASPKNRKKIKSPRRFHVNHNNNNNAKINYKVQETVVKGEILAIPEEEEEVLHRPTVPVVTIEKKDVVDTPRVKTPIKKKDDNDDDDVEIVHDDDEEEIDISVASEEEEEQQDGLDFVRLESDIQLHNIEAELNAL